MAKTKTVTRKPAKASKAKASKAKASKAKASKAKASEVVEPKKKPAFLLSSAVRRDVAHIAQQCAKTEGKAQSDTIGLAEKFRKLGNKSGTDTPAQNELRLLFTVQYMRYDYTLKAPLTTAQAQAMFDKKNPHAKGKGRKRTAAEEAIVSNAQSKFGYYVRRNKSKRGANKLSIPARRKQAAVSFIKLFKGDIAAAAKFLKSFAAKSLKSSA